MSDILDLAQRTNFSPISGGINFTGLGSGTDFNAIVDQLVQVESINKNRLELWRSTWESKITSMRGLNQRLAALKEAAGDMDSQTEFLALSATSSNSGVLTATSSNSATNGAHNVSVGSGIKHILAATGVAATTTVVSDAAAGNLVLDVGGTQHTINIVGSSTLATVRDAINAYFAGSANEVTASIEDDGTSSNSQRLVLTSNTGGESGRISVVQSPLLISLGARDVALHDDWAGATTSAVSVGGFHTGDAANTPGGQGYFEFTISNADASAKTVGVDAITLNYSYTDASGPQSGSVTVPADYTPGEEIAIANGLVIRLGAGSVAASDSFTAFAYAGDIDAAELGAYAGTSNTITTSGNYQGEVNKTFTFTATSSGDIDDAGSKDTISFRWTDSTGNTGTVSVNQSNNVYTVGEGLKINFTTAGSIATGDTFTVNVFAPEKQAAQEKGLAQAAKVVHSGFTDESTSAVTTAAATFTYLYGGESHTVAVAPNMTLSQLAAVINIDPENPGVQASIINDGRGLPNSYKLVLTGQNSGAQYQISNVSHTFTGSNFRSGGDLGGGFSVTQRGTNSMVKVDGFPAGDDVYLQRSTNMIEQVIPGVTLSLHDAGDSVVTVDTDTSAIKAKIEAFVNAVNFCQDYIRRETQYDPEEKNGGTGVLIGNYSYYILKSRIDSILNQSVPGLSWENDAYTHLSQIGIKSDPDNGGRWTIDSTVLNNALNSDVEAVADLFINNTTKNSEGVAGRMYGEMVDITDSETGTLNVLISNYTKIIENIDNKIEWEEKRLSTYRQRQMERFARLEANLAKLNAQSKAIESAIAQLPDNKK